MSASWLIAALLIGNACLLVSALDELTLVPSKAGPSIVAGFQATSITTSPPNEGRKRPAEPHEWTGERKRVKTLSTTDLTDQQVTEKLAAFEKEQDPTLLYEAMDLMEAAERELPAGDTTARKQALARRLRFFAALDRDIDPTWDIKNVPVQGVVPPPSSTPRMVYSTGEVDPSSIQDPVERAEYMRALKASKDYAKWYDVQYQLRRIDERAMRTAALLLPQIYSNSAADRREFEDLLAASPVSESRKDQLRAVMPEPA